MKGRLVLIVGSMLIACSASTNDCREVIAMAKMANARSTAALGKAKMLAGESYRARLVLAYRSFQLLQGGDGSAERPLILLPADDGQQGDLMTLGESLCDEESDAQMEALARVRDGFAREVAKAVVLAPRFLPEYVRYSMVAVHDPHSDFAVQMKSVCRRVHSKFIRALKQLPQDSQQAFSDHIMRPETCTALALPEGE